MISNADSCSVEEMDEEICNLKVYLWLRLMNKFEESRRSRHCIHVDENHTRQQVIVDSPMDGEIFDFTFDGVYEESSLSQELDQLYQEAALPIVQSFVQGYNGCIAVYGQTGTGKTMVLGGESSSLVSDTSDSEEECSGVLPQIIHDLFDMLLHSPTEWEYTLRCSYVELYMEKLFDLLTPNNNNKNENQSPPLFVVPSSSNRISIQNASEVCCIHPSDIFNLLVRGNANRRIITSAGLSEQQLSSLDNVSWRSHTFLLITLEQRNTITHHTRFSTLTIVDFAGSEYSTAPTIKNYGAEGMLEAKLIHRGFYALEGFIRSCGSSSSTNNTTSSTAVVPIITTQQDHYQYSKLTQILRHAIGGNCKTSFIVTASPSSCNIQETLNTFRFAQRLQLVRNTNVRINQYPSIVHAQELWGELNDTLRQVLLSLQHHDESDAESILLLRERLQQILQKYCAANDTDDSIIDFNDMLSTGKSKGEDLGTIVSLLQEKLSLTVDQRDQAEGKLGDLQSEVTMLRSFNRLSKKEQEKLQNELTEQKKESQVLSQKSFELERKLRTSSFRESQATVFLRQFRRFYRRLLKHKAALGTGEVKDIVHRLPGVPDLNDLIDVDTLLCEAGLIEETEKADDHSVATFRPSEKSLSRSFKAARRLAKSSSSLSLYDNKSASPQAKRKDMYIDEAEGYDDDASAETKSTASSVTESVLRQSSPVTNSWSSEREDELQALKEKCMSLQVALTEEKIKLGAILEGSGHPAGLKRLQMECMALKRDLNRKSHDLEAVIWKMNELHLINKTYSEKMSNREKHVLYLEETVQELQRQNRNLLLDKQSCEDKFREEAKNWQIIIESLRFPLWQFDEQPAKLLPITSRIMIPIIRSKYYDESQLQASSHGTSYESFNMQDPYQTFVSNAVQTDDDWPISLGDKEYLESNQTFTSIAVQTDDDWPNSLGDEEYLESNQTFTSIAVQTDDAWPISLRDKDYLEAHYAFTSIAVQTDDAWPISLGDINYLEVATQTEIIPEESKVFHDASAQTVDMLEKKSVAVQAESAVKTAATQTDNYTLRSVGVQTDSIRQSCQQVPLQVPTPNASNESTGLQVELLGGPLESPSSVLRGDKKPKRPLDVKRVERSTRLSNSHGFNPLPATIVLDANDDVSHITTDHLFSGGKSSNYVPKRFAPKLGLAIKPGCNRKLQSNKECS